MKRLEEEAKVRRRPMGLTTEEMVERLGVTEEELADPWVQVRRDVWTHEWR